MYDCLPFYQTIPCTFGRSSGKQPTLQIIHLYINERNVWCRNFPSGGCVVLVSFTLSYMKHWPVKIQICNSDIFLPRNILIHIHKAMRSSIRCLGISGTLRILKTSCLLSTTGNFLLPFIVGSWSLKSFFPSILNATRRETT